MGLPNNYIQKCLVANQNNYYVKGEISHDALCELRMAASMIVAFAVVGVE